jgi:hypothetical protein
MIAFRPGESMSTVGLERVSVPAIVLHPAVAETPAAHTAVRYVRLFIAGTKTPILKGVVMAQTHVCGLVETLGW